MKLKPKQIAALAALTVGALVVRKIAKDVKTICQMADEKEEMIPNTDEEIAPVEVEAVEVEVTAEAPAIEEAPVVEEEIVEIAEATEAEATETITE